MVASVFQGVFHWSKDQWNFFSDWVWSCAVVFLFMFSTSSNLPTEMNFQFKKEEKLHGARFSKYGEFCTYIILCFTTNCWSKVLESWWQSIKNWYCHHCEFMWLTSTNISNCFSATDGLPESFTFKETSCCSSFLETIIDSLSNRKGFTEMYFKIWLHNNNRINYNLSSQNAWETVLMVCTLFTTET